MRGRARVGERERERVWESVVEIAVERALGREPEH